MTTDAAPPRRYLVVGTGHRAELFLEALRTTHRDVGRVVALCDTNPTRMAHHAAAFGDEVPATYRADDFARALDEQRPDGVVVCSVDATHHRYVVPALAAGCHTVVEKPLTTTAEACRAIVAAAERGPGRLTVTFNYRYAPRNSRVKQLLLEGAIGRPTSVHFEWVLDTVHGADYFRRWHRDKANSGGLFVHKATHHFDLVNWWLDDVADTVNAQAALRFYGDVNARERGLGERPAHGRDLLDDPFAIDLAGDDRLRALYLDAEAEDGYRRDVDVFAPGITIEDNHAVLVRYRRGAFLSYALNAHSPWEGYRVAINGTRGRLELDVVERAEILHGQAADVVNGRRREVDPSAVEVADTSAVRRRGTRLVLQRHWSPAEVVDVVEEGGGHGGGDRRLLDDVFRGTDPARDPLGRAAGHLDGVRSVLVGVAANASAAADGAPVRLTDLDVPVDPPVSAPT
ncbi:Gfo/Idh/MocA family oxidoreductase [Egicoccus sp. AB-alg2]|uniref:Gfo/Idh/MocA family oxidoreductase n=1 Tax=Egicoccus sp. AB-alg2 TaxID=3242693 RepID=UPI00359CC6E4